MSFDFGLFFSCLVAILGITVSEIIADFSWKGLWDKETGTKNFSCIIMVPGTYAWCCLILNDFYANRERTLLLIFFPWLLFLYKKLTAEKEAQQPTGD